MESIYWVLSRDCNQRCGHCYNHSEPGASGLTLAEVASCVAHLPDPDDVPVGRVILSGGEVLVWTELLFRALTLLHDRYGAGTALAIQTNGDRLDAATLDRLLGHHVRAVHVSSMDAFHPAVTRQRRVSLAALFASRGMDEGFAIRPAGTGEAPAYAFWGATEETWIGPIWPRGRAMQSGLTHATPAHDFCGLWSGAKGFLDYRSSGSEVNVQLADVYPCCPMTCRPLGDIRAESLVTMLDRYAQHPVFRTLNEGRPDLMGETLGLGRDYTQGRIEALGNQCLWCDEFFTTHAPGLLHHGAQTERGAADLVLVDRLRTRRTRTE